jgi:prepilin-type N-terminal cleavage/methylation domain-containing protein
MNNEKGFTLIELMSVVVIIGILSAVALPKILEVSSKAKATELVVALGAFKKITQAHVELFGEVPSSVEVAGMALPVGSYFSFTQSFGGEELPKFGKRNSNRNGQGKTSICHQAGDTKSVTITVANSSIIQAHLNHGDSEGECNESEETLDIIAISRSTIGENCETGSSIKANVSLNSYTLEEVTGACSIYLPSHFSKMIAVLAS